MALEKTTKHIILIVSALVLATTTAICIAKRDSIANFLKPKIKQESSIYTPSVDTSVSSSNETPEEKTVTLKEEEYKQICKECDNILRLIEERRSLNTKNKTQEEYEKICEECKRIEKLLQEAQSLEKKAYDDLLLTTSRNTQMLLNMPNKSPEEKEACKQKEREVMCLLNDLQVTHAKAVCVCSFLRKSLDEKKNRLNEIEETFDKMFPGWKDSSNKGKF